MLCTYVQLCDEKLPSVAFVEKSLAFLTVVICLWSGVTMIYRISIPWLSSFSGSKQSLCIHYISSAFAAIIDSLSNTVEVSMAWQDLCNNKERHEKFTHVDFIRQILKLYNLESYCLQMLIPTGETNDLIGLSGRIFRRATPCDITWHGALLFILHRYEY